MEDPQSVPALLLIEPCLFCQATEAFRFYPSNILSLFGGLKDEMPQMPI